MRSLKAIHVLMVMCLSVLASRVKPRPTRRWYSSGNNCAVEAMGQGMASRAAAISNGDDAGVVEGIWGGESAGAGLKLRQDLVNVGGNGTGGLLPDVDIEGQHWTVPSGFFDAIAAVKMVIIAMCTVIAMFVVGRNI